MRKIIVLAALLSLAISVAGCSGSFQLPGQAKPAAIVNGKALSLDSYNRQVELATTYLKLQGVDDTTDDGKLMLAQMKDEVLSQMVDQEIINQAASKEGISITTADVDKAVTDTVAEAGGQSVLDDWLKSSGFTMDEFRQTVREQLTVEKVFEKVTASVPTTAEQVRASHILVATKEEADAVLVRLKAGESFAKVAEDVSIDDGSSVDGGDLGFFPKGFMIPEFETAAFALTVGKVSDPVQTQYGYHVILVTERDPNRGMDEQMLQASQQEAFYTWLETQRTAAKVEKLVTPTAK